MHYLNQRFGRTKYSVSCVMTASAFFIMSSGAQASELRQFSDKQTKSSIFDIRSLFTRSTINKKPLKRKEQKKNLTIAQQIPKKGDKPPINDKRSTNLKNPHRFYIGPDLFYRTYNENVPEKPSFISNEFGTLYGVQAAYDYLKKDSIYAGASFRYGSGTTTYNGSLQGDSKIDGRRILSTTDNQFLNAEGRLGYTFSLDKQDRFLISPFVGVGYHQWNRDIRGGVLPGVTKVVNVVEDYSWGYMGPGIQAKYQISPQFDIGLNAKLMMMVGGKIDFTSKDAATGQVTSRDNGGLGNALQYEVELPITYHLSQNANSNIDLKLTPYYRSQNIAKGPLFESGTAREPESQTSVYGATFGAEFSF